MKIYYDLESNGCKDGAAVFHPEHRIVQFCALTEDGRWFKHVVHPEMYIPAASTAIHGISNEQVEKEGTPFAVIWKHFLAFIDSNHDRKRRKCFSLNTHSTVYLCAHNNFGFDMILLQCECERIGVEIPDWIVFVATLPFFKKRFPELSKQDPCTRPYSLGSLYQHFTKKPLDGAHNAEVDVLALKELVDGTGFSFSTEHTQQQWPRDTDFLTDMKWVGIKRAITIFHHLQHQEWKEGDENKTIGAFRAWARRNQEKYVESFIRRELGVQNDHEVLLILCQIYKIPTIRMKNAFPFIDCVLGPVCTKRMKEPLMNHNICTKSQLRNVYTYHCKENKTMFKEYMVDTLGVHKNDVYTLTRLINIK